MANLILIPQQKVKLQSKPGSLRIVPEIITQQLSKPFTSNKGSTSSVTQLLIRVESRGKVGIGAGLVAKESRISIEEVREAIARIEPALQRIENSSAIAAIEFIERIVPDLKPLHSALDLALWDLHGKVEGRSVRELLRISAPPSLLASGYTLGAIDEAALLSEVARKHHYPILKFKLTSQSSLDFLRKVREGYLGRIWVDANGAWDLERAESEIRLLSELEVELLEQPLPPGSPHCTHALRANARPLIFADEDCSTLEEIRSLSRSCDGVVLKLSKSGSLTRLYEAALLARSLGLRVLLGCKTENIIGVTAAAQLSGLADYVDLDGHVDVVEDRFQGATFEDGRIRVPDCPGIGVTEL